MEYSKIGFRCGLEVHGQLNTSKLFCRCPSILRKGSSDGIIKRELRPLPGETGVIDIAALFERKKYKQYLYEYYNDTNCELEIDETPPREINQEALDTALTIALLLNCEIPNYVQVMRKTVVDGSNTSGFQRTAIIRLNGYLDTKQGRVSILSVCLEEDAARRTAETKDNVTFRLDRLGIPLVEIATGPDIKTPEQAKEVALQIGMLLRATEKAMRGIGTIRQDVNVSVSGHPRIELKGFQELRQMPETIRQEVQRQQEALSKKEKLEPHVRNVKPDFSSKFLRPMPGAARMYPETDLPLIEISDRKKYEIRKNLPELPEKKIRRLVRAGLNEELAEQVMFSRKFAELHKKFPKTDAKLIATTLISTQKEVKKKAGQDFGAFELEHYKQIFKLLEDGKIAKEAVPEILLKVAEGENVSEAANRFKLLSDSEIKKEIANLKKKFAKVPADKLKGIIVGKLRGRADVQKVLRFLN